MASTPPSREGRCSLKQLLIKGRKGRSSVSKSGRRKIASSIEAAARMGSRAFYLSADNWYSRKAVRRG